MEKVTLRPHIKIVNGCRFASAFSDTCIKEAMSYKPSSNDVIINTYPKCGTTWMQNLVLYIFRKGQELEDPKLFRVLCPFIDCLGTQAIINMPRPGAFKTHMPFNVMPYSTEAKYIYVLRNPKDCCVSSYYHNKNIYGFGYWDANFDDFFELFMAGELEYNDYFDHLDSWTGHRNSKQVFFTTYERMKADTTQVVLQLASFLGREYIDAIEKDNSILKNILHFSGFEYMKKHISELFDTSKVTDEELQSPEMLDGIKHMVLYTRSLNPPAEKELEFVRKGLIGDWKTHLNEEQSERLSKKFEERTRGTEIYDMYKHFV